MKLTFSTIQQTKEGKHQAASQADLHIPNMSVINLVLVAVHALHDGIPVYSGSEQDLVLVDPEALGWFRISQTPFHHTRQ